MGNTLPDQLNRIAVQRGSTLDFAMPPFPPLPTVIKLRYPEMKQWELRMDEWRRTVDGLLRNITTPQKEDPSG